MESPIQDISNCLEKMCTSHDAREFIPFLLRDDVQCTLTNKVRFYSFFKEMWLDMVTDYSGDLSVHAVKVKDASYEIRVLSNSYIAPRLTLEAHLAEGFVKLDIHPF